MRKIIAVFFLVLYSACSQAAPAFQYTITGISGDLLKNAQESIAANAPENAAALTPEDIRHQYLQAPAAILKALQPYGYFNARVQARLINEGDVWLAFYAVTLGEPLRITHLDVSISGPGKADPQLRQLLREFPLQENQIITMPAYNRARQLLFNTAEEQGYITAQFIEHTVNIDLKNHTAGVILHLATGPRFYFGGIKFSKNPFAESFLRRFAPFKYGDPYSAKKLLTLQDNLINSNYFRQVSVQAQRDAAQANYIPTQVTLTPRRPQQYTFGIGYGTDTGVRGTLGWDWRRVTATGQRFSTLLQLSEVQSNLQAIYAIPGKNPTTDQYNLTASALRNSINQGSSFTEQFGASDITSNGPWKRTLGVNYQFERFRFDDKPTQHSNLLIPGVTWTYLKADDPIYAAEGRQFTFNVQGAHDELLSSTRFIQGEIKGKYITSPFENSRFILRGDVGYTAVHDLASFPLTQYFYAGGTQSVRGYAYQALGPGKYLAVASAEYQHRIVGNWSGAIFYDAGNATNHTTARLMRGAGFGVVWKSPVGPMSLTIAKALSKPGQPNRIQFNMGPDLG